MQYGFIYQIFQAIIQGLKYLNLVELFKLIAMKLNPKPTDTKYCEAFSRVSVDIFIVLKWVVLIILFCRGTSVFWSCFLVWYLIITNIYTYFFYHVWDEKAINPTVLDTHILRRRFVNLLLAISFSHMSFAYLYYTYYSTEFTWSKMGILKSQAIWFSISNSVAANYNVIAPKSDLGNSVSMIQLVLTFMFVTIIISRSIPQKP